MTTTSTLGGKVLRTSENEVLSIWAREVSKGEIEIEIVAYLGIYSTLTAKLGCSGVLTPKPNSSNFVDLQKICD